MFKDQEAYERNQNVTTDAIEKLLNEVENVFTGPLSPTEVNEFRRLKEVYEAILKEREIAL
jgi:hypothetical protein